MYMYMEQEQEPISSFSSWDISGINHEKLRADVANIYDGVMLLNTEHPDRFSYAESFIYECAMKHMNARNMDMSKSYCIEFWTKNDSNKGSVHIDKDENHFEQTLEYIYPAFSCVTYLTNSNVPTIVTDITNDQYIYKTFSNKNKVLLNMPKVGTQITFDGRFYHGYLNLDDSADERLLIVFNVWENHVPLCRTFYAGTGPCDTKIELCLKKNTEIETKYVSPDTICRKVFNNFLYYDCDSTLLKTGLLKHMDVCSLHTYKTLLFEYDEMKMVREKKCELEVLLSPDMCEERLEKQLEHIVVDKETHVHNRFFQRARFPNFISKERCNWIINESEKYAQDNEGWETKRHVRYPTTDLPVKKIPSIFNFLVHHILFELNNLIIEMHCLPKAAIIDFKDLFVVKYEAVQGKQDFLEMHTDGGVVSGQIVLNDLFEGGGTYFDDGIIVKPKCGELLLHGSCMRHAGLPIISGSRYILVFFVAISFKRNIF